MGNMRFKVGDRVRIKSLDWYNENKDEDGNIRYKHGTAYPIFFTKYMSRFCGETLTIKCVHKESYYMNETGSCEFWTDEMIEGLVEEETYEFLKTDKPNLPFLNDFMDMLNNEISLPEGYQFKDENGNVINATKIVLEKKKKEYPKSYEECCKVLNIPVRDLDILDNMLDTTEIVYSKNLDRHLNSFRKLLICRDAYWKIAGDEMGLGEPWKPIDNAEVCYGIFTWAGEIYHNNTTKWCILTFPTSEMRDAFYENFKELIEQCKELL